MEIIGLCDFYNDLVYVSRNILFYQMLQVHVSFFIILDRSSLICLLLLFICQIWQLNVSFF